MIALAYAALVVAIAAAILGGTKRAAFVAAYLAAWQIMEIAINGSIITSFVLPDFPYYLLFGVFIDYFFITALIHSSCRSLPLALCLVVSIMTGTGTLLEGYYFGSLLFFDVYGPIMTAIAVVMAWEGVDSARNDRGSFLRRAGGGSYRRFSHKRS